MAKKQRISNLEKYVVLSAAAFADGAQILIAAAEEIPVVGIVFVAIEFFLTFTSFIGFTAWYVKVGMSGKRMWQRIWLNILLLIFSMIVSWVPYGGPIMAYFLMFFFTVRTYFFIRSIQKEDKEEGEKSVKLTLRAQGARKKQMEQIKVDYARYTKAEKVV